MKREEEWLLREKYKGETCEAFFADCERLRGGEPLAYLIGHVPFLGTTIYLDSHPLIPRPETEYWLEQILKTLPPTRSALTSPLRALDLCAGSGCIGVAVLKAQSEAYVDFAEIGIHHHATIRKNIAANGLDGSKARIIGGDLFENIEGRYDVILSNPPYIDPRVDRTEPSVRAYEPPEALYGGLGGLELIYRILDAAPRYLTDHGILVVEHEPEQVSAISNRAHRSELSATPQKDQYGLFRYTVFTRRKDEFVPPY